MVTGKWAFIYLTPVLRICCNFFVYSERCASQLVMIYWLWQRNNSHMVKHTKHICTSLCLSHTGGTALLSLCLFVCLYGHTDLQRAQHPPAAKLLCSRDHGIAQAHLGFTKPNVKKHNVSVGSVNVCACIIGGRVRIWHYLPKK